MVVITIVDARSYDYNYYGARQKLFWTTRSTVELKFKKAVDYEEYWIRYVWILTIGGAGDYGVPHMSTLTLHEDYGRLRGRTYVGFNVGHGTTGELRGTTM